MEAAGVTTRWHDVLTADEAQAVTAATAAAEAVDGVGPWSEQTRLALRPDAPAGHHLIARAGDAVVGCASLDLPASDAPDATGPGTPPAWPAQAEVLVNPAYRRHGVGTALVEEVVRAAAAAAPGAGPARLGIWAHGDSAAAAALAARTGFVRERVLWQLDRPLSDELPPPDYPAGVRQRAFVPGQDEDAWLRINAAAFAHHPEQGRWTIDDLAAREKEPWFDPAGFLLAVRADNADNADDRRPTDDGDGDGDGDGEIEIEKGDLVGFHWTKVHDTPAGPLGEVYVVGVDPAAAGGGLGRALTLAGLLYLRERGVATVMLYVDDDNPAALRLYRKLGFREAGADVSYVRTISG